MAAEWLFSLTLATVITSSPDIRVQYKTYQATVPNREACFKLLRKWGPRKNIGESIIVAKECKPKGVDPVPTKKGIDV